MAPKKNVKKSAPVKAKAVNPLFPPRPRSTRVGGNVMPANRDLSRMVKWPKYVRIQRQRAVLYQRLKVPPQINQFTKTLSKNSAATLFKLFNSYRPATKAVKKQRNKDNAATAVKGETNNTGKDKFQLKFGLKHVTTLIEEKKATLVAIACDVNPIELVVWLPALCRKMDIPFVIVKDKARLGALVHQKTAAVVCLTGVEKGDQATFSKLSEMAKDQYNNNKDLTRTWGGGIMGLKTQAKLELRAKAVAAEEEKKAKSLNM